MARSWRALGITAVLAALAAGRADAATDSQSFTVQATVSSVCRIVSATTLNFGSYDPTSGAPVDQSSQVTVICTNSSSYNVYLDQGTHASGGARRMAGGGTQLPYELYTSAARSTIWGQTGANGVAGTGNGANQVLTVYGRIPASQNVPPGAYTDSITATISY